MDSAREQILSTIRAGLAQNKAWLEAEGRVNSANPPPYVLPPEANLADQFTAELRKLEGRVYRAADDEEALEMLAEILALNHTDRIVAWDLDQIGLPGLAAMLAAQQIRQLDTQVLAQVDRKERLQILEPAQVCLSGVEAAIAESGSLVLVHGPEKPRLASLLAPVHVAIVREGQLVRGLGEAIGHLRDQGGVDPFTNTSNITLITGPSRTADIEMTLTLGIHGPKEIHVVLIADSRPTYSEKAA
jgi:L-lactate dehydrogenase complex protein LldG